MQRFSYKLVLGPFATKNILRPFLRRCRTLFHGCRITTRGSIMVRSTSEAIMSCRWLNLSLQVQLSEFVFNVKTNGQPPIGTFRLIQTFHPPPPSLMQLLLPMERAPRQDQNSSRSSYSRITKIPPYHSGGRSSLLSQLRPHRRYCSMRIQGVIRLHGVPALL